MFIDKNAFNLIRRDKLLISIREFIPESYNMLHQAYGYESFLFHGESKLHSATGIQQGDPAGPALFSLTIDEVIKSLQAELNIWFLDDGTLGDSATQVIEDLDRLLLQFPELGAILNGCKCELTPLCHTDEQLRQTVELFRRRLPTIKIIMPDEQSLLGSPLMDAAVPAVLRSSEAR